ncbi:10239_t:CDS:2 [Dentiscutata erythropus]|uniref:10239_t:CDS:1 n=1 Tax=Dentiscutata erythropus TaxID=1348616 RepID=A0A9N9CFG0_9GLOM|nr:10239_t:CDS:2 [Dentiscutata erythropus]
MPKVSSPRSKKSSNNIDIHKIATTTNVPFPPDITTKDLLAKSELHGSKPRRTPNAFISYKMVLHRELKSQGFNYPIPVISRVASLKWQYEPMFVKSHYMKLADKAKQDYRKSRPFFIMAPGCKNEKETNPQKEGLEVEIDNCNESTHSDNGEQESYNVLPFELRQQEMNLLNASFIPLFSNEYSASLYEYSAPLNEYSTTLNGSSVFLNEVFTSLNEPSVFLYDTSTSISNDSLQISNFYPIYYIIPDNIPTNNIPTNELGMMSWACYSDMSLLF